MSSSGPLYSGKCVMKQPKASLPMDTLASASAVGICRTSMLSSRLTKLSSSIASGGRAHDAAALRTVVAPPCTGNWDTGPALADRVRSIAMSLAASRPASESVGLRAVSAFVTVWWPGRGDLATTESIAGTRVPSGWRMPSRRAGGFGTATTAATEEPASADAVGMGGSANGFFDSPLEPASLEASFSAAAAPVLVPNSALMPASGCRLAYRGWGSPGLIAAWTQ
mmetsp:Transcript_14784/g.45861  ORF Transcript_14784/g.45861 Transcript_14784/m.45861 type:complete len:225 (+) Transcript_14784:2637-3311(+)